MTVAAHEDHGRVTPRHVSVGPWNGEQHYSGLAEVLDSLPERVIRYRIPDLTIVYCNASWAAWYNLEPAQALGHKLDEYLSPDGLAGLESQLAVLSPENPLVTDPVARVAPNAPGRWIEWVDRYLDTPGGDEVLAVGRDVTARHIAEVKLAESEARFRDLADKSTDILWHYVSDPYPHLDYVSPSVEGILGYTPSYLVDDFDRFVAILTDKDRELIERALNGEPMPDQCDFHYRHANGSIVIGEVQFTEVEGGLQGVVRDVTELRRLQESLAALALRDPLTGLANRRLFKELLEADLARTQRGGLPLAVAFVDLDDFKNINDSFGHDAGDKMLCETAERLMSVVRGADIVARLGGDEFVIVYEPNDPSADKLVERLEAALSAPTDVSDSVTVSCTASIGVADTRSFGYDGATLLAAADAAMYQVKREHHGMTPPRGRPLIAAALGGQPLVDGETYTSSQL